MSVPKTPNKHEEPVSSRPHMPDYGISKTKKGLIAWTWVDEQMTKSRNYWICSTRPDGKPHAAPVWGVWMDNALYFSSARSSRKARNLTANPEVTVHLESGDDTVIFEGRVEEVTDKALLTRMLDVYAAKYPPFKPSADDPANVYYVLKARVAFAWQEKDFPNTATRWKLSER